MVARALRLPLPMVLHLLPPLTRQPQPDPASLGQLNPHQAKAVRVVRVLRVVRAREHRAKEHRAKRGKASLNQPRRRRSQPKESPKAARVNLKAAKARLRGDKVNRRLHKVNPKVAKESPRVAKVSRKAARVNLRVEVAKVVEVKAAALISRKLLWVYPTQPVSQAHRRRRHQPNPLSHSRDPPQA